MSTSRRKTFLVFIMYSTVVILILCLVSSSEGRSLKEVLKGKGKYIPDDCYSCEPSCRNGTEVCKERIIYGDIIVCTCIPMKLSDIPVIVDLTNNQF
ncbi:unnamed protein product [Orchesella dallaii]|uniref:Uncharacterized protein n=1 Tax=Orchesella dallaii TaxID=48710 RepID=A0ABP1Q6B1_9HEXA